MIMSSSETTPQTSSNVPRRRRQKKRYSAKFIEPLQALKTSPGIVPLVSPKDPNYQASSLSHVSTPFDADMVKNILI
jgi:hypothetical protein